MGMLQVRIVQHAFEIINLLTDSNPIQVLVDAIINRYAKLLPAVPSFAKFWLVTGWVRLSLKDTSFSCAFSMVVTLKVIATSCDRCHMLGNYLQACCSAFSRASSAPCLALCSS